MACACHSFALIAFLLIEFRCFKQPIFPPISYENGVQLIQNFQPNSDLDEIPVFFQVTVALSAHTHTPTPAYSLNECDFASAINKMQFSAAQCAHTLSAVLGDDRPPNKTAEKIENSWRLQSTGSTTATRKNPFDFLFSVCVCV